MKRLISLLICTVLVLSGCKGSDMAHFYYPRAEIQYDCPDGVIASEERDTAGHGSHLSFLISLYLIGPLDSELASPFPTNTKLLSIEIKDSVLYIRLTDTSPALSDSQFTLACTCLTLTCLEITTVESVSITSGERDITLSRDQITLFDTGEPAETTIGG